MDCEKNVSCYGVLMIPMSEWETKAPGRECWIAEGFEARCSPHEVGCCHDAARKEQGKWC